jgi:hypothetical protein
MYLVGQDMVILLYGLLILETELHMLVKNQVRMNVYKRLNFDPTLNM